MRKFTLVGAALLAAASITAAGCGDSGDSDEDTINSIVIEGGKDPSTICDHVEKAVLTQLGGKDGCVTQSKTEKADDTTKITSTKIDGDTATVSLTDKDGATTVKFKKEDDKWVIAAS